MKLSLPIAAAAALAVTSFSATAGITDTGKRFVDRPEFIQAKFTADEKPVMFLETGNNDENREFVILDDQFNEVRKISFSYPEVTATYTVQRKIEGPINVQEQSRDLMNEINDIPLSDFLNMGQASGYIRREDHGTEVWLLPADEYRYYAYEAYGFEYPEEIMIWAANRASVYHIYYYADGYGPIPGKFQEPETLEESKTPDIVGLDRKNADCLDYNNVELSQTLFNTDAQFEWVIPVYSAYDCSYENEYEKVEGKKLGVSGYKVVSENGSTIASFDLPAGYSQRYEDLYLYEIGSKNYIIVCCSTDPQDYSNEEYVVYEIDAASSSVRQIAEPRKVRVSPTAPRRGTSVNVEFGTPAGDDCKVVVTSVNGRTVLSRNIAPGTTATAVDTDRFEAGMYIVTVTDGRSSREATKIIIR